MTQLQQFLITDRFFCRRPNQFTKTGRAQNFVFVFGNALPAEKPAALRTASHCFPRHMILTTLMSKIRHRMVNRILSLPAKFLVPKLFNLQSAVFNFLACFNISGNSRLPDGSDLAAASCFSLLSDRRWIINPGIPRNNAPHRTRIL